MNNKNALKYGLIALPILVYVFMVYKYALNIPCQDDYDAILSSMCYFKQANGLYEKFLVLYHQHGDHRILPSQLVYAFYFLATGTLNFKHFIFIGNLQLLLAFLIIFSLIKRMIPTDWFLPGFLLSLCMFDINGWENATFAMAAMQNYGVIFLFVASLYCYTRKGSGWLVAGLLFQIMCTFSSGNGMIASAVLLLYNIMGGSRFGKIVSIAALVLFVPLYFVNYSFLPTGHASAGIVTIAHHFIHFSGAHVVNNFAALFVGLAVLAALVWAVPLLPGKIKPATLPIICILGFVVGSMLETSIFRSGFGTAAASRYMIYPNILFAIVGAFVYLKASRKHFLNIAMPAAAILFYSVNFTRRVADFEVRDRAMRGTKYYYPNQEAAHNTATRGCENGIYCIEQHRNQ